MRRVAVVYGEGTKAGVYIQATLFTRDPVIPPITAQLPRSLGEPRCGRWVTRMCRGYPVCGVTRSGYPINKASNFTWRITCDFSGAMPLRQVPVYESIGPNHRVTNYLLYQTGCSACDYRVTEMWNDLEPAVTPLFALGNSVHRVTQMCPTLEQGNLTLNLPCG